MRVAVDSTTAYFIAVPMLPTDNLLKSIFASYLPSHSLHETGLNDVTEVSVVCASTRSLVN